MEMFLFTSYAMKWFKKWNKVCPDDCINISQFLKASNISKEQFQWLKIIIKAQMEKFYKTFLI